MKPIRFNYDLANCSIRRSLEVVGEKWSLLVLREVAYGVRRFDDFARALGCGRGILSARLKTLTAAGILERRTYRESNQRSRAEYRLTDKGRDLYPVLLALLQWGDRWMPPEEGSAAEVTHSVCGQAVTVEMICRGGHGPLTMDALRIAPGPGAKPID